MNPKDFQPGAFIRSVYSGKRYVVVVPDSGGMAKLRNEHGQIESWNSCNNPHFELTTNQLTLF